MAKPDGRDIDITLIGYDQDDNGDTFTWIATPTK